MSNFDPDISNGTCYYKNGGRLPARYIPCGNAALGHKTCCESLDMCLSSRACYNGQYGVTYLAGCTDRNYDDGSCPEKSPFSDQQWAGLVLCHPTYNDDGNEWIACEDSGSIVTSPAPCTCPDTSRTVAFTDFSVLKNIVSLPASHGGTVTWKDSDAYYSAHTSLDDSTFPTESSTSTSTRIISVSLSTGSAKSSPTSSSSALALPTQIQNLSTSLPGLPATPGAGMSMNAKIGIGLGTACGLMAILLFGWLSLRFVRCRRAATQETTVLEDDARPQTGCTTIDPDLRSPSWSGHKSELAADESTMIRPETTYQRFSHTQSSEVEGSPVPMLPPRPREDGSLQRAGQQEKYYEMAA